MVFLCKVNPKVYGQGTACHMAIVARKGWVAKRGLAQTHNFLSFFDTSLDLGNVAGRIVIAQVVDVLLAEDG